MTQHETHTHPPLFLVHVSVDGGDTDTTFNLCKQMSVTCIETERVGTLDLLGANREWVGVVVVGGAFSVFCIPYTLWSSSCQ